MLTDYILQRPGQSAQQCSSTLPVALHSSTCQRALRSLSVASPFLDRLDLYLIGSQVQEMAIAAMREIYSKADRVLVLDDILEEVSTAFVSPTEMLMRIQSSTWMRRLWIFGAEPSLSFPG